VTKKAYLDLTQGPSYSFICSNGTFIYIPSLWYNFTYSYWDYYCGDNSTQGNNTANSTYYDDYYDQGCYKDYSYFYNESTVLYQLFPNETYIVTYFDGLSQRFDNMDLYGFGDKTYVETWYNETTNCTYFYEQDTYAGWVSCQNGSILFYPPSDWFNYYYTYDNYTNYTYGGGFNYTIMKAS
jgi:hypothetical protein